MDANHITITTRGIIIIKFHYENVIIFDKPCIRIFAYDENTLPNGSHKSFDVFFPYNEEGADYLLNQVMGSVERLLEVWEEYSSDMKKEQS